MKVAIIKEIVKNYKRSLSSTAPQWDALYEYPVNFAQQSKVNDSILDTLKNTFKSQYTQRLWKTERYRPLETFHLFYHHEREMIAEAMEALYQPERALEDRIDLFRFLVKDILLEIKKSMPHKHISDANWEMQWISLLLSAKAPLIHPFYHQKLFFEGAAILEMKPSPSVDDYIRYSKMINIILTSLEKEHLIQGRLNSVSHWDNSVLEPSIKNVAVEALALFTGIDIFNA